MAAHAYIKNAARMAVFGAQCAGLEPDSDLWRACCADAFNEAVRDVSTAFVQAGFPPEEILMVTMMARCTLCGEPMPETEQMFKYHGYSGPCPKPPLAKPASKSPEDENKRLLAAIHICRKHLGAAIGTKDYYEAKSAIDEVLK